MGCEVILETNINHEPYAEDGLPNYPFSDLSVNDVLSKITDIREMYPGYDNYEYRLEVKYYGYGAKSAWYNLIGITYPYR